MPEPTPISLIVDDSAPLIHVYRCHVVDCHHREPVTKDGRTLAEMIPNGFLDRFCDVVERHGMAGKFSIVPSPGGRGDVVHGVAGFDPQLTKDWLATAKQRLGPRFDFCSEGVTHNLTLDLTTGAYLDQSENDWSQTQTRETLTPYLYHQLQLLKDAGIDATGVTSPWVFGAAVETEYIAVIVAAQREVYGRDFSWYFLHMRAGDPAARPWVAHRDGDSTLVSIPSTTDDFWWQTIDSPRTDEEFIQTIADAVLTRDGRNGAVRRILDGGGVPILLTHWQSLFSNGLETGLAAMDEVGRRIASLGGEARWMSAMELARWTVGTCAATD